MGDEPQPPEKKDVRQWTIAVKEDALAFKPRTWQEMSDFALLICKTEFVPDAFRDKPGAVLAAWQTGHEVGLPPMASLRYIAVINGRPRIWGNGFWSLIKGHPLCESTEELAEHEALEKGYGECTVKRRGEKPVTARFTKEMAVLSGVWGGKGATQEKKEQSPWFKRPGRMLQWMARNLAGNDAIPEATIGLEITELAEAMDEPRDVTPEVERPITTPRLKETAQPESEKKARKKKGETDGVQSSGAVGAAGPSDGQTTPASSGKEDPKKQEAPQPGEGKSQAANGEGVKTQESKPVKSWKDEKLPMDQRLELWIEQSSDDEFKARPSFFSFNLGKVTAEDSDRAIELCKLVDVRQRRA